MAVTPRQAERREAARSAMLEVAISRLAAGGYARMTLAEVGRQSGYSHGLAPFYFGSKAGLMAAVSDEIARVYLEHTEEACAKSTNGLDFLRRWVDAQFDFKQKYPEHLRASLVILVEGVIAVPELGSNLHARVNWNLRAVEEALARGVADGSIVASTDLRTSAVLVTSSIKGTNYDWLADPGLDLDHRREAVHQLLDLVTGAPGDERHKTPVHSQGF